MIPEFVSYHTPDYEPQAKRLRASLARFDLPHYVQHVPADGTWSDICRNRHAFIAAMLEKHAPRPVVWLDSDCIVLKRPELFLELASAPGSYDIGLFRRPSGPIGGVIYAEPQSKWFWELCQKQQGDADSQMGAAYKIARDERLSLKVYPLTHEYQYCPWLFGRLEAPLSHDKVVILHEMARTGRNHGRVK